jgi:NADH-quinone oxidoreductase subunit L
LEPVFGHRLRHLDVAGGLQVGLAGLTVALALVGIAVAYAVVIRQRVPAEATEPQVLRRAWYVDDLYRGMVETPGRLLSAWSAFVLDLKVIDGAVNGVAALVRAGGNRLRTVQSGYVRNYALGVAVGAVLILGFALARASA